MNFVIWHKNVWPKLTTPIMYLDGYTILHRQIANKNVQMNESDLHSNNRTTGSRGVYYYIKSQQSPAILTRPQLCGGEQQVMSPKSSRWRLMMGACQLLTICQGGTCLLLLEVPILPLCSANLKDRWPLSYGAEHARANTKGRRPEQPSSQRCLCGGETDATKEQGCLLAAAAA